MRSRDEGVQADARTLPSLPIIAPVRAMDAEPERPDPEIVERPCRRRFEYRMAIVREADACTEKGLVGVLLRREGLYSSHLTEWRRLRDHGGLAALSGPRGRTPGSGARTRS